jgi:hypothetical protein
VLPRSDDSSWHGGPRRGRQVPAAALLAAALAAAGRGEAERPQGPSSAPTATRPAIRCFGSSRASPGVRSSCREVPTCPSRHRYGQHHRPTTRRRTGGEEPATRRHQPTRNDSKRQGQRRYRSIAAGIEMGMLAFTRQRPWFGLVLARKTVSAAHRCNRTMTCRSALDTDAAYGRQPLLYSAPSLLESSWWPAVPRIRLLPRRQVQPGRLPRVRR